MVLVLKESKVKSEELVYCRSKWTLTWTWCQQTWSDVLRFGVHADADGVIRGAAHDLPLLSPITTSH